MADEQAPLVEDAPEAVETPGEGTATQEQTNWEERYKEAQAWGTRNAQRAAELEAEANLVQAAEQGDTEAQRALLSRLGYELPEQDDEYEDTQQELDPRIAARLAKVDHLEQQWHSLTEAQQQEQHYSGYRQEVDPQLTQMGVPEAFVESVADIAYNQLPAIQTPQGPVPDLEGAVKQFEQVAEMFATVPKVQNTAVEAWRRGKKAPHMSPVGQAATGQPNLEEMTEQEILDWQLQRYQDLSADS